MVSVARSKPDGSASYTIEENQYNGLHWRVLKRSNTTGTPPTSGSGLNQERTIACSASWQVLQEEIFDNRTDSSLGTQTRRVQTFWGTRYIDDCILHRVNTDPTGDDVYAGSWYHLTDPQFSTIALLDQSHLISERVRYTPYGEATHRWGLDVNDDGYADEADYNLVKDAGGSSIGDTTYDPDLDLNLDGVIDGDDCGILSPAIEAPRAPMPPGQLSNTDWEHDGPDNTVGYCGYRFNSESGLYTVRFRHYAPEYGRWLEPDPLGYVDGMNDLEYVVSSPLSGLDPFGTQSVRATSTAQSSCSCNKRADWDKLDRIYAAMVERCGYTDQRGYRSPRSEFTDPGDIRTIGGAAASMLEEGIQVGFHTIRRDGNLEVQIGRAYKDGSRVSYGKAAGRIMYRGRIAVKVVGATGGTVFAILDLTEGISDYREKGDTESLRKGIIGSSVGLVGVAAGIASGPFGWYLLAFQIAVNVADSGLEYHASLKQQAGAEQECDFLRDQYEAASRNYQEKYGQNGSCN